jgi:aryl sulfotransferase
MPPIRYQSPDEDSARWTGFRFRQDDIVISTRSKSGTTWVQMICALLVFQRAELPDTLNRLSPWLDWLVHPREEVYTRLEAQDHRRFIKTHTPLDGLPLDDRATYIVVARHPLDAAVSLYYQSENIDRARLRALTGDPGPPTPTPTPARPPLHEWLVRWVARHDDPRSHLDSLPGVLLHYGDAWARRGRPNVVLVHYDDLSDDLEGEMRRVAGLLGIEIAEATWPALVEAATFETMRQSAGTAAPDSLGVLKDPARFFRRGRSGQGRETLSDAEWAEYKGRAAALASPDMLAWLHHGEG